MSQTTDEGFRGPDWDKAVASRSGPTRDPLRDELIRLLEEYADLLGESETRLAQFAATHNYSIPREMVKRGEDLREQIATLKNRIYRIHQ